MPGTAALPGGLFAATGPLDPEAAWIPAWRVLGETAHIRNPFYEAGYALAAAGAFGAGVRLLLVADRPLAAPGARLLAAWPYRRLWLRWGVPLPLLMGWTHGHCPFGAPLLDGTDPEAALKGLLAAPGALGLPPRLLMPNAPADGPLPSLLDRIGGRQAAYWPHARGMLDLAGLPEAARAGYLGHLSAKRRRKLRLGHETLEAGGPVALEILCDPAALDAAFDDYVALEAAGWKGRAGTSLSQRPEEAALLRAAVRDLGGRGRLRIARLRRGGETCGSKTLAAAILPLTGPEAWVLKIAHDESEAEAAPGVQLVHRLTQAVLAGSDIVRIDSCAPPDLALGSTFWTGRRRIAHRLIEAGRDPLFPVAAALERTRERVAQARLTSRSGRSAPAASEPPSRPGR